MGEYLDYYNRQLIASTLLGWACNFEYNGRSLTEDDYIEQYSFACKIVKRELNNYLTDDDYYNLYVGMAADTCGFTKGNYSSALDICNYIPCKDKKEEIIKSLTTLTHEEQKLYDEIILEKNSIPGLLIYKLEKDSSFENKVGSFLNPQIENKIEPKDENIVSCLIIICNENIYLKIRKNKETNFDIVDMAMKCNGGGHADRAAGKFLNSDYNTVLDYIKNIYTEMSQNLNTEKGKVLIKK